MSTTTKPFRIVNVELDQETYRKLRVRAAMNDVSMRRHVEALIKRDAEQPANAGKRRESVPA